MESAPSDIKKIEGVQTTHQWIDLFPAASVNPHRNRDRLTRFGVPGKVDAKRGEVMRALRIGKVSRNAELERTLTIPGRVGFAQTRLGQVGAKSLSCFTLLPAGKLGL